MSTNEQALYTAEQVLAIGRYLWHYTAGASPAHLNHIADAEHCLRAYAATLTALAGGVSESFGNSEQLPEPAAWIIRRKNTHPTASVAELTFHGNDAEEHRERGDDVTPLYTAPPAQPAERVPEGMVLVPVEPTEAMLEAGRNAVMARDCSGPNWGPADHYRAAGYNRDGIPYRLLEGKGKMSKAWGAELVYHAMLAASPASAAQGQPGGVTKSMVTDAITGKTAIKDATLADMAKRLEAAERDSRRLDWLETQAHCLTWNDESERVAVRASDGAEAAAQTWREAIDKVAATQEGDGRASPNPLN